VKEKAAAATKLKLYLATELPRTRRVPPKAKICNEFAQPGGDGRPENHDCYGLRALPNNVVAKVKDVISEFDNNLSRGGVAVELGIETLKEKGES
jgi:hypothetical protein